MVETGNLYGQYFIKALNKEIGWLTDTVKCMLCTKEYIPDQDEHVYLSDIVGELTGYEDYPAGGFELLNKTMRYDPDLNKTILDADDIEKENVSIGQVRYAVIYIDTGTPETSPLLGYMDFGAERGVTNGFFSIHWSEEGIFAHTVV